MGTIHHLLKRHLQFTLSSRQVVQVSIIFIFIFFIFFHTLDTWLLMLCPYGIDSCSECSIHGFWSSWSKALGDEAPLESTNSSHPMAPTTPQVHVQALIITSF